MSHTVKVDVQFRDLPSLLQAFISLGFTIRNGQKRRTYFADPDAQKIYEIVAVNPNPNGVWVQHCRSGNSVQSKGYDMGIEVSDDGEISLFTDPYDQSLQAVLGDNYEALKSAYALAEFNHFAMENLGQMEHNVLENGEIQVEITI